MLLTAVLQQLVAERAISPITIAQYRRSIDRLADYLGRPPTIKDLNYETVNGYLAWLETTKALSAVSVRNHRIGVICLWNYAVYPLEITSQFITRRIRCPRVSRKPVVAWSIPEVGKLLSAAKSMQGRLRNGLPVSLLLEAWIRLGTETGLRPSDLRILTWQQIDLRQRSVALSQHKTGEPIVCWFSAKTAQALRQLARLRFSQVFPVGKSGLWKWEQRLYRYATMLGFNRGLRQGLGTLRKTHGTQVYSQHGLAASAESLGHRSGTRIARDHYVDSGARKVYAVRIG